MFRHILVPLDGSHLAEAVLPVAAGLSRALHARITLQHVVEPAAPPSVHGDVHVTTEEEAEAYLRSVAEGLAAQGVRAVVQVDRARGVAEGIARRAEESGADLIVLATHGSSGVRELLFGRVTEQVLTRGTIPVLLMAPTAVRRGQPFAARRILVSLDRSEMAEAALSQAADLARAFDGELVIVTVVPTVMTLTDDPAVKLMPTAGAAVLDLEAAETAGYLEAMCQWLTGEGVRAVAVVERGEPARMLLERLGRSDIDLMVMATHGRSGVSAVWAGSVASRVLARASRPVLLIRVPRVEDP